MSARLVRRANEPILGAVWLAFALHTIVPDGGVVAAVFDEGVYNALLVFASAACLLRAAVIAHDRWAWAAIGAGLTSWTVGDLYYQTRLIDLPVAPIPSLADAFYLAYFPLVYSGVVILMRRRIAGATRVLWVDGITAGLAVAGIAAAVLVDAISAATDGPPSVTATNLAYPLGDIVLLTLLTTLAGARGFRLDRATAFVLAGVAATSVADAVYLVETAHGSWVEGGFVDALWPASLLLIASAGWRDTHAARAATRSWSGMLAIPMGCGVIGVALLVADGWIEIGALARGLAAASLVGVLARLALTLRENRCLLAVTSDAALTDTLTELPNRRALVRDLTEAGASASLDRPVLLALFDLNGFKGYNDSFGHPAGDALLQRLGGKLAELAASADASAYRLGGDEFCLLVRGTPTRAMALIDAGCAALCERGEEFEITASFGSVLIPEEAAEPSEALRIADARLYSRKSEYYHGRDRPHEDLVRALHGHDPELGLRSGLTASTAVALAKALGITGTDRERVEQVALLQDVGALAVPDDIMRARHALSEPERALLRQHPTIGGRILSTIPALRGVAPEVRATHERWDGRGFPDGLQGEEIPLAARIATLGDAFAGLVCTGSTPEEAVAALVAEDAGRFDPALVRLLAALPSARFAVTRDATAPPQPADRG